MVFRLRLLALICPLILLFITSCKKDDDKTEFDRNAMLVNVSSAVIIPALNEMETKLTSLHSKAQDFTNTVNSTNLGYLKTAFLEAYKSFQKVKMFNFGPLEDYGIVTAMNTYPTDTSKIQGNISSGSYILESAANITAIGLPAIDFLIYNDTESEIIADFSTNPDATNTKIYLTDITSKMQTEFASAKGAWGTYQTTFIEADGNDIGGSTGILFNTMLQDIELIKNAKIGIPAGYQTAGQTLPNYVEAHFSQYSVVLAMENLSAIQNVFNGATGIGFDDYIKDVEDESITISLADNINAQFDICKSTLNSISTPLSIAVDSNPTQVEAAWLEVKKLLTYTKTDMSSILGLLITFQDNDGD